ncbi:RNase adapter RapZ [Frankia sp. AgB32]|uniref:RapZ C-terminal domain-containing protein n=1 Tax=Frankia sp. AgB32 TaxID=631119 RepID=UPI00200BFDE0|nr:RNase adapter RapZ [Frankia sp. AgB32]MCK9898381.1 ATPase [Frankia sp. AgB32]
MPRKIVITSFGFLHSDQPPAADLVVDLRPYRDPHISPELRDLTARDPAVRRAVLTTPGIRQLIDTTVASLRDTARDHRGSTYRVAVGCAGGRHRAPTVADSIADGLQTFAKVTVTHRDLRKAVVHR